MCVCVSVCVCVCMSLCCVCACVCVCIYIYIYIYIYKDQIIPWLRTLAKYHVEPLRDFRDKWALHNIEQNILGHLIPSARSFSSVEWNKIMPFLWTLFSCEHRFPQWEFELYLLILSPTLSISLLRIKIAVSSKKKKKKLRRWIGMKSVNSILECGHYIRSCCFRNVYLSLYRVLQESFLKIVFCLCVIWNTWNSLYKNQQTFLIRNKLLI